MSMPTPAAVTIVRRRAGLFLCQVRTHVPKWRRRFPFIFSASAPAGAKTSHVDDQRRRLGGGSEAVLLAGAARANSPDDAAVVPVVAAAAAAEGFIDTGRSLRIQCRPLNAIFCALSGVLLPLSLFLLFLFAFLPFPLSPPFALPFSYPFSHLPAKSNLIRHHHHHHHLWSVLKVDMRKLRQERVKARMQ